ncbi:MAG: hypothetical protein HDS11_06750 [Bacteroides sp.]|nr:hypothetical protein [Bacteroides sp.]
MRTVIFLLTLLCWGVSMHAEDYYADEAARKAVKTAYELLKVHYPEENQICPSDSVYGDALQFLTGWKSSKEYEKIIGDAFLYSLDNYNLEDTTHSQTLSELFAPLICHCNESKYVIRFSPPIKNMILCEKWRRDRKVGISGGPDGDSTMDIFIFFYNDKGEIVQMRKGVYTVD